MKDSTHIKAAKKDVEQRLLQNDDLSGSVNCLNEMKKIASLIEAVSDIPSNYSERGPFRQAQAFIPSFFPLLNRF